jgi:superfamily II DNA or RNA helicase/HKD family nuclease
MSARANDLEDFHQDVRFGYLDRTLESPRVLHPQLVLNTASTSMLRALRHELRTAKSFTFSVAFVSPRAIALLKQEFLDFEGVGRIVTSDYLGFNSPSAFEELLNLRSLGIDVRLHQQTAFHPKGYVFGRANGITAILGSSNLTESALSENHEWNIRVSAARDSDLANQFTNLLDEELFSSSELTSSWVNEYAKHYQPPKTSRSMRISAATTEPLEEIFSSITPNAMQTDALSAIAGVRGAGKSRALIVSATGTGKTILSALDVRAAKPERVLFIAHREQILDRSIQEFQRVLGGPSEDFGKLAGKTRQADRRYVFATVQTLSQQHVLDDIDPKQFDYVLVDEVHRAGASSFKRVFDYLRPQFMLGMTATPERTDGYNIFEMFDYNVPFEIRLNTALELDMLAPFHYYGIADITFDDGLTTSVSSPLLRLVESERVDHILRAIETYGQAGVSARGLMFCSRNDEAAELSRQLNNRDSRGRRLRTIALSGDDSIEYREDAVERLEAGELDYILTVDIFNEGVDIPTVNQVIMLRQTKSSIVFIQQLGRGLRKAPGKEYLVVIDFIGNYANNYLIPIALFGDDSLNKESLKKNLIAAEEVGVMAGLSSVRFDRIAQERVLRSLVTVNLDSLPNLKSVIEAVQQRVGRVPLLSDFLRFESADPVLLATKLGNYPLLLRKLKIADPDLTERASRFLSVISREFLSNKRPHELLLLRDLLVKGALSKRAVADVFTASGVPSTPAYVEAAIRSVTLGFNTASEMQNFESPAPADDSPDGEIRVNPSFDYEYRSSDTFRSNIDDVIDTGLKLINARYDVGLPFTPGRQYSRKDASRLLNWTSNMYSTIYGYKVDAATGTCPIFVTLHKSDDVSTSTAYEDALIDTHSMRWYSKSKRTLSSPDVDPIVRNAVDLHVFAKKDDAEGTGYYYLGRATADAPEQTTMRGNNLAIVRMLLRFDQPIQAALFDYFHTDLTN